jgi:hypothetical protein
MWRRWIERTAVWFLIIRVNLGFIFYISNAVFGSLKQNLMQLQIDL